MFRTGREVLVGPPAPPHGGFIRLEDPQRTTQESATDQGFHWKKLRRPWTQEDQDQLRDWFMEFRRGENPEKITRNVFNHLSFNVMNGTRSIGECRSAVSKLINGVDLNTGLR
jgi:hypothetical protein